MKKMHALTLLIFSLCSVAIQAQKTETRSLESFNAVAISGGFEVVLQSGSKEEIKIETSGVDADKVETRVENNTLKVGMKRGSYNNAKIKLTITYEDLTSIVNSGSSDIVATSTLKGSEFSCVTSGSGDFKGSFDVSDLSVVISGSGDFKMSGTATNQSYVISGSGDIHASDLKGQTADIKISGSGDVALHIDGSIKQKISGSGNVTNK